MAFITRLPAPILAIILGLPILFPSLFRTVFTPEYEARPVEAVAAIFLEGSESFIDKVQAESRSVGYASNILTPDDVKAIREKLNDITGEGKLVSIDIGSTHIHSGIDTQGLWGNIPQTGRDESICVRMK